jgi:non-specific serine/threonine protein kinase
LPGVARTNLPAHVSPFVGRAGVVAALSEALADVRLVSLVGDAGTGKTTTALQVAARSFASFADGVWYVRLASVADPAHCASQFLSALALRETPGRPPLESVLLWLASREALLVVDDGEEIVAEAARIVRALVERCPKVRVLATGREALSIYGERTIRLPALTLAPPNVALTAPDARRYEAVALFERRAMSADPQFRLTDSAAATARDIGRRLEGIALAIELAAARVKTLMPLQILGRLDERVGVPTEAGRGADRLQPTLHGAIAWSYDELSERERQILDGVCIFAGPWPLASAISLCAADRSGEDEIASAIEALAVAALIEVDDSSDETTYRLPASVRAFVLSRAAQRGTLAGLSARHAAYALAVSERLDADYLRVPSERYERSAGAALADVRAALAWTLEIGHDPETGIALVANLRWVWSGLAPSEGLAAVRRARALAAGCELSLAVRAKLAIAEAALASGLGDYRTQRDAAFVARRHWEAADDELETAIADRTYAQALLFLGDEREGLPILEAALGVFRAHGCATFAALALDTLGVHHFARGDIVTARGCLTEAIALARASGFTRGLPFFNVNLAEIEALSGNVEAAIALCRASIEQPSAKRELYTLALAWSNLAMYYARFDRWDDALEAATSGFAYARESGVPSFEAFALQTIAAVYVFRGDAHDGARLAGYVDARITEIGFERGATENGQYQRLVARARAIVGRADVDAELARGRALSPAAALQLAGFAPEP